MSSSIRPTGLRSILLGLLLVGAPHAGTEQEIEQLIVAIESSGCGFVRNGKVHSAHAAGEHLRMKYRRGKRHVGNTEQFIDRLASKSSLTRKPYLIDCAGVDQQASGDWLRARLDELRKPSFSRDTGKASSL